MRIGRTPELKRPGAFAALGVGWLCYGLVLMTASGWLQSELSLRAAFPDPADREGVRVVRVKKPSTITFSNGRTIDVGPRPARIVGAFIGVAAFCGLVCFAALAYCYAVGWPGERPAAAACPPR